MSRLAAVSMVALLGALVLAPVRVDAHTGFDHSAPAKSESVDEPPEAVEVWFTASLMAGERQQLWVEDEDGDRVAGFDGEISPDDPTRLAVGLPDGLPDGRYTVKWYVQAADGMFARGSYRFYVGIQPTQAQLDEDAQLTEDIAIMDDESGGPNVAGIVAAVAAGAVILVGGGAIIMRRRTA